MGGKETKKTRLFINNYAKNHSMEMRLHHPRQKVGIYSRKISYREKTRPFRHTLYRMVASAAMLVLAITGTYYYLTQPNEEIISPLPNLFSAVQLALENGNKITLDDPQSSVLALNNNAALHAGKTGNQLCNRRKRDG